MQIPKTTVSEILTQDLDMKRVMAKFIPRLLPPEQKEHHTTVANDLIQIATNEEHCSASYLLSGLEGCNHNGQHLPNQKVPLKLS